MDDILKELGLPAPPEKKVPSDEKDNEPAIIAIPPPAKMLQTKAQRALISCEAAAAQAAAPAVLPAPVEENQPPPVPALAVVPAAIAPSAGPIVGTHTHGILNSAQGDLAGPSWF